MIKLVAIDLDGTMYNSQKVITTEVRTAILAAHAANIQTAIITGRGQHGAEMAIEQLGIDMPFICSAGAMVRAGTTGDVLGCWPFYCPDETNKLIRYAQANNMAMLAEQLDGKIIWGGSEEQLSSIDPKTQNEVRQGGISSDPIKDYDQPLLKLTLRCEKDQQTTTSDFIMAECPSLFHVISSNIYMDVTKAHVNKGFGLAEYARISGFTQEEVAAIGDQEIDLHAFHFAGLPIAMENGVQKLKDHAEWIAPSNDDHGVAWALTEIIKRNAEENV